MAGRGTDIKLGGSKGLQDGESTDERDEVVELGGLCVVGTGRHDTERLDNQLRGRAGRQGDPGRSVFFSSVEDPVVTRNLTLKRDPVSSSDDGSLGSKGVDLIEQAQRVAEGVMLELHANTWRYNQLVNQQRDIVIARRMKLLTTDIALVELKDLESDRYRELVGATPEKKEPEGESETTSSANAEAVTAGDDQSDTTGSDATPDTTSTVDKIVEVDETPDAAAVDKSEPVPEDVLEQAAREIMLFHLDRAWADHLAFVSDVRASIHLRSLGRESPLDEFHKLILDEFSRLPGEAVENARKTFREAVITADGVDLEQADLRRSTTTWTYMVHDSPFSSGGAKALQGIIGIFR
jgi:preprotein translocase subunit SecA